MARGQTVEYLLKANVAGFVSGTSQARKELDHLDANIRKTGAAAAALAAGGFAVAAAGVALVTKRVIEAGSRLSDLSAKTGVSAAALQKIGHAAKLGGSDIEAAAKAMNIFQKNLVAGGTEGKAIFQQLGLSAAALRKDLPEGAFLQTAEAIRGLQNPTEQAAAAMAVFGKAGADMLPAIKAGLAEAAAEAERLGFVMSDQTVAAADALGDSIDTLTATWGGLLDQFGATIVESATVHKLITGLTDILGNLSGAARDNKATLQDLVDNGVLMVADGLLLMVKAIGLASDAWGSIKILWMSAINLATDLSIAMAKASKAMPWTSGEAKAGYEQDIKNLQAYKLALAAGAEEENKAIGDRKTLIADLEKQFASLRAGIVGAAGQTVSFGKDATTAAGGVLTLATAVKSLGDRMKEAVAAGNPFASVFGDSRSDAQQANDYIGSLSGFDPGNGIPGGGNPYDPGKAPGISWGQSFEAGFQEGIKDLPSVILGAIQGGGDVGRSIGAHLGGTIGTSLGAAAKGPLEGLFGKLVGGSLAAALPGVGSIIGSLAGGLFGKLFGGGPSKEEREAARQKAEQERQRIQDAARSMRSEGVGGIMEHAPQFFMQRTITDAASAQRQGAQFAAAWGAVVKEKGIVVAAAAFGDAFAKMKADIEAAGIEIPAWMKAISGQMELGLNDEFKAVAEAAHTAAEFLKALADAGGLSTEALQAFEQDARAAFAAGKSIALGLGQGEEEAAKAGFAAANPLLQGLLNESIVSGQSLSADIQALIEQAGIVPDVDIQSLDELRQIRAAVQSLAGMGGTGNGGNGGPPDWVHDIPQFAEGKRTGRTERTGGGGFLGVLHENESVVPDSDAVSFAHSVLGGRSTNSGSVASAFASLAAEVRASREPSAVLAPQVTVNAPGASAAEVEALREGIRREFAPGGPMMRRFDKRYNRKD